MRDNFFLPTTIILCVIIFVGWHQFFYTTTQREILNMELETRRLREIEREISELKARHENLSAFVETKEFELDAARNFLPSTIAQDKFIDELYRTAEFRSVRIISIQTGEVISAEKFQSQVITVNVETDYISLLNFIRELLDGSRLINLENFSAESVSGKIISCELSFKIFAEPIKNPANNQTG